MYTKEPMEVTISIHSTARVETHCVTDYFVYRIISIHSTARVETNSVTYQLFSLKFQSTPPRGWRRDVPVPADYLLAISIHSTARVETDAGGHPGPVAGISIHSTARVETVLPWAGWPAVLFQSTPPRGWRPYANE